jgi:hypothetical protein
MSPGDRRANYVLYGELKEDRVDRSSLFRSFAYFRRGCHDHRGHFFGMRHKNDMTSLDLGDDAIRSFVAVVSCFHISLQRRTGVLHQSN